MNHLLKNLKELGPHLIGLRKDRTDVYDAFQELGKKVYVDGELSHAQKELIAMAISIATKCDPCIAHHARALAKMDVSREAYQEMLEVVIQMGGGPGLMKAGEAMALFDEVRDGG